MICSTFPPRPGTNLTVCEKPSNLHRKFKSLCAKKPITPSSSLRFYSVMHKSVVPLAASLTILLSSNSAEPGFLYGLSGIESIPGPELPQIDFLNRLNEENQKEYADADARFKTFPLLKKLLEQSELNKEKNRLEIQDKYCIRGAEWGVGDCSAEGMSPEDKENFIAMLKKKSGLNE